MRGEGLYVEDFNSILSRLFHEGIGPIEKQNWGKLVGSCVRATAALNMTILSEELDHYSFVDVSTNGSFDI